MAKTIAPTAIHALAPRVRAHLHRIARQATPITYKAIADALELTPPNTIHQVSEALEHLMREDAANSHPFIAALVISKARGGLPAPGFFDAAHRLGRFDGHSSGREAWTFHGMEFAAVVAFWRGADSTETDHVAPSAGDISVIGDTAISHDTAGARLITVTHTPPKNDTVGRCAEQTPTTDEGHTA